MIDPPGLPAIRRADPEFLLGGLCAHAGAGSEFKIQDAKFKMICGCSMSYGLRLAKGARERFCGMRVAGLRCGGAYAGASPEFKIQDSRFKMICGCSAGYGPQLANGAQERFCGMR